MDIVSSVADIVWLFSVQGKTQEESAAPRHELRAGFGDAEAADRRKSAPAVVRDKVVGAGRAANQREHAPTGKGNLTFVLGQGGDCAYEIKGFAILAPEYNRL